jgi:hypothetical protein
MLKIYNTSYKYINTDIIIFTANTVCFNTVHVKPMHNYYNSHSLYWLLPEDGNLLLKYIAGIMFMDNLQLFTIYVHLLL